MKIFNNTKHKALHFLKKEAKQIFWLLLVISFGISINSYIPIVYGRVFDSLNNKNIPFLHRQVIIYFVLLFFVSIFSFLESKLVQVVEKKIEFFYQHKYFDKLLEAKISYIEQMENGYFISSINMDIQTVIQYIVEVITTIIYLGLNFLVPLFFIININVRLSIIALVFLPLSIIIYYFYKGKRKSNYQQKRHLEDNYTSFLVNNIYNIRSIKIFNLEKKISLNFRNLLNKMLSVEKDKISLEVKPQLLNEILQTAFIVLLITFSATLIVQDEMTIGLFTTFSIYAARLFESICTVQNIQFDEQPVSIALNRLNNIENAPIESYDNKIKFDENLETLCIKNVDFSYPLAKKQTILKNISLDFNKPGLYTIVGKNGSGKTTLIKLLMGFYEPNKGEILINQKNYQKFSIKTIRNHITYIEKTPFIINDSIYNNLSLYNGLSEKDVLNACNMVGLSEYFLSLPEGLNTALSNENDFLSSGMKQKLNFARAILHQTEVMIFDEITSDLDGVSEKKLVKIIKLLSKTSIVISISHRIRTIQLSDCIFVLEDGVLVAQGNSDKLFKTSDEFKKLYE